MSLLSFCLLRACSQVLWVIYLTAAEAKYCIAISKCQPDALIVQGNTENEKKKKVKCTCTL